MNILYIGICSYNRYEGISAAFEDIADNYHEVRPENVTEGLKQLQWFPNIVIVQIQGSDYPSAVKSVMAHWRNKGSKVISWNGDIRHTTPDYMYDLAEASTVTCFSNYRDVDNMRIKGFKSEFLQIGIDPHVFTPEGPKVEGEIVFMANHAAHFPNGPNRLQLCKELKAKFGDRFKIYGNFPGADGECNVKNPLQSTDEQKQEAAIYRGCKVAISMSSFQEEGYTSDRLFRAMGSGAFTLVHEFPRALEVMPDCLMFNDIKGMVDNLDNLLNNPNVRHELAKTNCDFVHNNYTYDHMVKNIIEI